MTREAFVLSTGIELPGDPIDNEVVAARFGANAQWIDAFVGTRTRHFALDLDTGASTHTLTDIATSAATCALARAGLSASDIDVLVLGTATPDHLMPSSAALVADRLGLSGIPTYQLQSGCSGAVSALEIGTAMLSENTPTVLVIGADVCAKHMRLDRDVTAAMAPAELINYVLFGDGAGAVVLSHNSEGAQMRMSHAFTRFTGLGRTPGQQIEWFGLADRHEDGPGLAEDYKAIEKHVPLMSANVLRDLLAKASWTAESLDYLMPPQLSGRMTARIREQMVAPAAKEISVVAETGNNGNALPFLQLDALAPLLGVGNRAAAVAIESSKWIEAGFLVEGLA